MNKTIVNKISRRTFGAGLFFAAGALSYAQSSESEKEPVIKAANAWLALVDAEKYDESWKQAAALFRGQVEQNSWVDSLQKFRNPMGALISRDFPRVDFTKTLRGAPDGEYVIIHTKAAFKNKEPVTERITLVKEADGWKVSAFALH